MKRKPTPAQIAARERFAEMARSGAFKRKAKRNPAKKRSSQSNVTMPGDKTVYKRYTIIYPGFGGQCFYIVRDGVNIGSARSVQEAKSLIDMLTEGLPNPAKKTVSQKISQLTREGYPQKQAVAIALSEERAGKVKRNPISDIANIIYNQLGANRFAMMTGAKNFVAGDDFLMFSIGKNQSVYNKVRITLTPDDLYDLEFFKMNRLGDISKTQKFEGVYAEQLQDLFTQVTGLYTSMGTMGRRSNPRASNPIILVSDRKPASKRKANPVKPKKQRMLNISWLTAGGQREMKSVPIEFVFTHYVGNVAERFFVRTENGQLIVSEYSTGGRIGQVPYTMRAAALNDREAAKRFVGEMLSRIGAERFKAAVKQFDPIN